MSPKTTGRRLTSLRVFGKWAGLVNPLTDYIAPTPGRSIPHPIPEGVEGLNRMIASAKNIEQAAIIGLCGFAGLRIGEALTVSTDSIDLPYMTLTVRGKGDKTRTVPLSHHAWSTISSAYVMAAVKPDKKLVSYQDRFARRIVTQLGKRASLARPVSSHDLRATFATAVYDQTPNLRLVQELLGHSSSSTTETYTGVLNSQLRSAVEI